MVLNPQLLLFCRTVNPTLSILTHALCHGLIYYPQYDRQIVCTGRLEI